MKTLRSERHKALTRELRRVRKEAGVTQAVLAERLGVPQSFIAKVEGAERRLDVIEFIQWLRALGAIDQSRRILEVMEQVPDDDA